MLVVAHKENSRLVATHVACCALAVIAAACGSTPGPRANAADEPVASAPRAAAGVLRVREIPAGPGATVTVEILPGELALEEHAIVRWVERAVDAIRTYYGRFPVEHATVVVVPVHGRRIGGGLTHVADPPRIRIEVGARTPAVALERDWMMTHEFVHLALPSLPARHHWLEEGSATYVEPLARAQAGQLAPERVWFDMIEGLPQGLPEQGDRGLDRTHTWGRTYWGGALFCLLADIEIRERTGGHHSLQDALRAVMQAGGTIAESWPLERVLAVGDRAVGVDVLTQLHARMSRAPEPVDLDALWRRLGVAVEGRSVTFDDSAPHAELRKALTAR